jgi:hypothetical protein
MIGIDYWLFNMMGAKKELRYHIHSSFKNAKMFTNPQTSFTDIARLISADVFRSNQTYYSKDDLSSLIYYFTTHSNVLIFLLLYTIFSQLCFDREKDKVS